MTLTSRRWLLNRSVVGVLCSLTFSSWAGDGDKNGATLSARAPVWTEALGEVQFDQYTPKERAQMVRDYWTAERIRTAIPVDIALPDDSVRALLASTDVPAFGDEVDAGSSPQQPYDPDFWTQERLCDALRNAIPVDLLSPDGSVRALLTEAAAADGGSSRSVIPIQIYLNRTNLSQRICC